MKKGVITKRSRLINVYDVDGNYISSYWGYNNAARATGVKPQNIYKTCNGYKTTLNGYYFKFSDGQSITNSK